MTAEQLEVLDKVLEHISDQEKTNYAIRTEDTGYGYALALFAIKRYVEQLKTGKDLTKEDG